MPKRIPDAHKEAITAAFNRLLTQAGTRVDATNFVDAMNDGGYDSTYTGNLLKLGDYSIWVDGTDALRIKNGEPTSATDGSTIGGGGGSNTTGLFTSTVADGASAIGFSFSTDNNLTGASAKLMSLKNVSTEKFAVTKDGGVLASGITNNVSGATFTIQGTGPADGASVNMMVIDTATVYADKTARLLDIRMNTLSKLAVTKDGKLLFTRGDTTGTPGNATSNTVSGLSSIASGGTTCTVTAAPGRVSSLVFITPLDIDTNVTKWKVSAVDSSGNFTVTVNTATAAAWRFNWWIID